MDEKIVELTEAELEQTAGGSDEALENDWICNSKAQRVGKITSSGIEYYPCEKCGKPTHQSFIRWYCDPCDKKYWSIDGKHWSGTRDELKAASL